MNMLKPVLFLILFLVSGNLFAAQPAKLFEINGSFEDAVMSDGILFLAVKSGEGIDPDLRIFRVGGMGTDKGKTTEIGSYRSKEYAHSLARKGNYLFLINGKFGLEVIDISNPAKPDLVHFMPLDGYTHKIVIKDELAYVTGGFEGMHILDISSPRTPRLLSTFQAYAPPGDEQGADGIFQDQEDYGSSTEDYGDDRQYSEGATIDLTWEDMISVEGAIDVTISGDHAYIAYGSEGIVIVDISNPAKPVKISSTKLEKPAESIFLDHKILYTTLGLGGVHLIDVAHPETPKVLSLINTRCYPMDVSVIEKRAFVADGICAEDSLYVLDIADSRHPRIEQAFSGMVNNIKLLSHAILAMGPNYARAYSLEF